MKEIVFATNNKHKIEEISALLNVNGSGVNGMYKVLSLSDIGCAADIPETADTFTGNALQKAEYVKSHFGYDCFADDSGLEVEALGMAPGIHSARYAADLGHDHDSEANMDKLLAALAGEENRAAQFRTVVVLLLDGKQYVFEGICRGTIAHHRLGNGGFGYDPVFVPEGFSDSFAQMSMEAKNAISHRGKAVRKLVEFLQHQ